MPCLSLAVPSPAELRTDLGPLAPPRPPAAASFSVPPVAVCPPAPARLKPRASAEPQSVSNHVVPTATHRLESVAVPLSERLATRTSSTTGFNNGDIIVNALPTNRRCAWITKAEFKPELVPEELMATGLTGSFASAYFVLFCGYLDSLTSTCLSGFSLNGVLTTRMFGIMLWIKLTVEEYVAAMQVLVHDVRFTLYNVCYKRLLLVWVLLGFFILLCLLFSGVRGLALFGGGVVWLVVNALGIFVKADTISKCFNRTRFVRNAEALEDDEQSDTVANEELDTDDVWSSLVESNFVTATDTFREFVYAGESELAVCEEASRDDAIVAVVHSSSVEVATDDDSDGEDDVNWMLEPDFLCKDALQYLKK
ncbi:hypothetical protein HPB50_007680 [Hyalomma asiaticum]|uniref:Uncharacterized protein n=1 Tax=Hyalomma asiaticum TaxID=266040 RepID=A0ACB7TG00_HYAAI|nr:hypothetical protein HPB50_007680 [Hyalomma asiaticum]